MVRSTGILLRVWADLASALMTALFLLLDVSGSQPVSQRDVEWQWFALGAFAVFVVLVYARVYSMHGALHARERDLHVEAEPELGPSGAWRVFRGRSGFSPDGAVSGANVKLAVTNIGDVDRTVTRVLLEFRSPSRIIPWRSRLLRRPLPVLTRDGEVIPSDRDGYVDWRYPASGPRIACSLGFEQWESSKQGNEVTNPEVWLILEVGSPEHRIRKLVSPR